MENEFEFLAHVREADNAPQSLWQHLQETTRRSPCGSVD
jgi:hypothetical protein